MKSGKDYRLSQDKILSLLEMGDYKVCLETGDVTSYKRKSPKLLACKIDSSPEKYKSVELYYQHRRLRIQVHRLVWIAGTGQLIPDLYDVHHLDHDTHNNNYNNLIALHKSDHAKLHQIAADEDDTPF